MLNIPCPSTSESRQAKMGGLVIPAPFRRKLGLKTGDEILLRWIDGELSITKVKPPIKRYEFR